MSNYSILRFSCTGVFRWCFCAGVCLGGLGGIALGLLDRSAVGIFGGMFLGFIFGLFSGLAGLIYAAVFNILSPITGGLAISLAPQNIKETMICEGQPVSEKGPLPETSQSPLRHQEESDN